MKTCHLVKCSGGRQTRRGLLRKAGRIYRKIVALIFAFGCCWASVAPAQAGFAASLVPYKDVIWYILYALLGLFVVVAVWEIVVLIVLRRAGVDPNSADFLTTPEKTVPAKESGSGLLEDNVDPFQALLNQASTSTPQPNSADSEPSPANPTPSPSDPTPQSKPTTPVSKPSVESDKPSSATAPSTPLIPFNGAKTLPIGAMANPLKAISKPIQKSDDNANPFKRLGKDDSSVPSTLSAVSSQIGGGSLSKQLGSSAPSSPSAGAPRAATPAAPAINGSATISVQANANRGIAVGGVKLGNSNPLAPMGASSSASPSSARPFGVPGGTTKPGSAAPKPAGATAPSSMAGGATTAAKPMGSASISKPTGAPTAPKSIGATPAPKSAGAPVASSKPAGGAGGAAEDPWKKLLGQQTGGRPAGAAPGVAPAASASASSGAAMGAEKKVGGVSAGSAGGMRPAAPSSPAPGSSATVPRPASPTGGNDPWKALLGASGKGGAKPGASSAAPSGISLGIKKPDNLG